MGALARVGDGGGGEGRKGAYCSCSSRRCRSSGRAPAPVSRQSSARAVLRRTHKPYHPCSTSHQHPWRGASCSHSAPPPICCVLKRTSPRRCRCRLAEAARWAAAVVGEEGVLAPGREDTGAPAAGSYCRTSCSKHSCRRRRSRRHFLAAGTRLDTCQRVHNSSGSNTRPRGHRSRSRPLAAPRIVRTPRTRARRAAPRRYRSRKIRSCQIPVLSTRRWSSRRIRHPTSWHCLGKDTKNRARARATA